MTLDLEKTPFTKISDIQIPDIFFNRLKTGEDNLDAIFGMGGILPGSTITLKARPGVGKSVFALTLAEMLTNVGYNVAYSTGEEAVFQIAYNCKRLGIENLEVGTITDIEEIMDTIPDRDFMVIDSYQTLTTIEELNSKAKNEYFTNNLVKRAKDHDCTILFIVQETVSGEIRGGTSLLYAVDTNIEILKNKDNKDSRLFDVYKNRFGATMMHEAIFTSGGYEFIGEYEKPEKSEEVKVKKEPIKETRKELILAIDEPPLITLNRVMETCGIQEQTAKLLLSELENDMKLLKFGRGQSAVWKKYKV
jgi:predicted ATP-dependent serine protease